MTDGLNVLIVCGQGTYEDGAFFSEYDERDLYLHHAIDTASITQRYGYDTVVTSGSYTKAATPALSESRSFARIWEELSRWPLALPADDPHYIWEEAALDSAQNILFGLMAARLRCRQIGRAEASFRRIGVWTLWTFKRVRYTMVARALGITERFYFHGLADATQATAPALALAGEQDLCQLMRSSEDPFLFAPHWEHKRHSRNVSPQRRDTHLHALKAAFPMCFDVGQTTRWQQEPRDTNSAFCAAFREEVLRL